MSCPGFYKKMVIFAHAQFRYWSCPSLSYLVIACPVLSLVLEKKNYFRACAGWTLVLSLLVISCHSLSYVVLGFTRKRYFLRMLSSDLKSLSKFVRSCHCLSCLVLDFTKKWLFLHMRSSDIGLVLACHILS